MPVIEVFADIWCPFAYVGLRRLFARRADAGRPDVPIWVRSWPLELVDGEGLDADVVAEEVHELRQQVDADLFAGFDARAFPTTTLPALDLVAAAYRESMGAGERVSLGLRTALFERGLAVDDPTVLADIAQAAGVDDAGPGDRELVLADLGEGRRRDVIGSPHFFSDDQSWFCPALDIQRIDGHLRIEPDAAAFDAFAAACFG